MVILIVEDEALLAMILEASLKEAGYEILGPVATADRALALAEDTRPDLALVDIRLRGTRSGVDVVRALRERGVPSLFLSGQREEALVHRESALGLLVKPYMPATVLASIAVAKCLMDGGTPPPPEIPRELVVFNS